MKDEANSPTKKGHTGGKALHVPTTLQRTMVRALVTAGLTQDRVARVIGIDKKTLQKHYRTELDSGREDALGRNTVALMRMADKGNAAAAIYLQKCLGGVAWNERNQTEHEGTITLRVVYGERD